MDRRTGFLFFCSNCLEGGGPQASQTELQCVLSQKPFHTRSFCPRVPGFTQGVFNQAASKLVALPGVMV